MAERYEPDFAGKDFVMDKRSMRMEHASSSYEKVFLEYGTPVIIEIDAKNYADSIGVIEREMYPTSLSPRFVIPRLISASDMSAIAKGEIEMQKIIESCRTNNQKLEYIWKLRAELLS